MKNLRRKRLVELLEGPRFNGDRASFLASSGLSKGRLTQLLDPKEAFGDAAARNLCDSLSLPDGWFDSATGSTTATEPRQDALAAVGPTVQMPPLRLSANALMLAQFLDDLPEGQMKFSVFGQCMAIIARAVGNVEPTAERVQPDAAKTSTEESRAPAAERKTASIAGTGHHAR